jgi:hypothetical protein
VVAIRGGAGTLSGGSRSPGSSVGSSSSSVFPAGAAALQTPPWMTCVGSKTSPTTAYTASEAIAVVRERLDAYLGAACWSTANVPMELLPQYGTHGVPQQTVGNMVSYVCPKCGARWMATRRRLPSYDPAARPKRGTLK